MTLEKFRSLIAGGEKATVDFKISCNAFNKAAGDRDKAKAELVKDICAMANSRIPGDIWGREHYDWPATFRTLSIPIITLPKIDNTQGLRDLASRSLDGIQGDEILFRYVDTTRRQLNQKIQLSLRRSLNAKADPEFNRGAITQSKRHLHAISRLAFNHNRLPKKSS